jgi:hypothetical protein
MVPTRSAVTAVHSAVADLTARFVGRVLHEPQVFPQYPQPYFATFWLDPWASCSKRYAITTETDHTQRNPLC